MYLICDLRGWIDLLILGLFRMKQLRDRREIREIQPLDADELIGCLSRRGILWCWMFRQTAFENRLAPAEIIPGA